MVAWWIAAALCLGGALFHASQRRRALLPLATAPLSTRWLAGLCWDVVTLLFAVMATTGALAVTGRAPPEVMLLVAGLAIGVAALSARSGMSEGLSPVKHPAVVLMSLVAVLAVAGG